MAKPTTRPRTCELVADARGGERQMPGVSLRLVETRMTVRSMHKRVQDAGSRRTGVEVMYWECRCGVRRSAGASARCRKNTTKNASAIRKAASGKRSGPLTRCVAMASGARCSTPGAQRESKSSFGFRVVAEGVKVKSWIVAEGVKVETWIQGCGRVQVGWRGPRLEAHPPT